MSSLTLPARNRFEALFRIGAFSPAAAWSLAGSVLTLIVCLSVGSAILGDPDTQWHIATGRWMIEHGTLPHNDMLSHTFAGQPWIAKEWLSQLLLTGAYLTGGWTGVVLLASLAVALSVYLIMIYGSRGHDQHWGYAAGLLAFVLVAPTVVARPHLLVFPIVVAWTLALMGSAETTRRPPWFALPLMILWANLHAAFTIGLVIAAGLGLEAVLKAEHAKRPKIFGEWLAFGLACLAAIAVTPYGLEPLLLNVKLASGNEAVQYISEWQVLPIFSTRGATLLLVAAASLYALAQKPLENAARLLLVACLTYAAVRHDRFGMFFGLVTPIVAGAALVEVMRNVSRRLDLFQDVPYLTKPDMAHVTSAGLALAGVAILLMKPIAPPEKVFPATALDRVPAALRQERVFNSYNLGGFLAYNNIKTFIDGRTDQLFLGGFMTRVIQASSATEAGPLAALLDEYEVKWAMIRATAPEATLFPRLPGWQLLHEDPATHIYKRLP